MPQGLLWYLVSLSTVGEVGDLGGRVSPDLLLHASLVLDSVLLEEIVGLGLGGRLGVRVVEKVLHAEGNLLHGDGRLPTLVLVQDRKADSARGVDVRVEQGRRESAYKSIDLVNLCFFANQVVVTMGTA